MIIINNLLTDLLPIFCLFGTIIAIMLSISWSRNHFLHFSLSILGLVCSLISLFFIHFYIPIEINFLFKIDDYAVLYSAFILVLTIFICIISYFSLDHYYDVKDEFYLLILLSSLGCLLLTMTVHMISLFIGLELVSLPLIGLLGYFKNRHQVLESTLKYMILSGLTSTFLLFGIALVYIGSGGLSFIELQIALNMNSMNHLILLFGIGMILIVLFFKLSLFPFHLWVPDVYQGTSALTLTFFSTVVKTAIFVVLVRLFLYLPVEKVFSIYFICSIVAICSILFGNLMALFQINLKRLLAYSSISHFGYLLIILVTLQSNSYFLETVGMYLFGYCLSNLGLFTIINYFSDLNNKHDLDSAILYKGLFWRNPILCFFMTSMIFSLSGIPLGLGFISKFFLFYSIMNSNFWFLWFIVVLGTVIGLYYYLRISINLYLPSNNVTYLNYINNSNVFIVLLGIINIIFGLFPAILIDLIRSSTLFL